MERAAWFEQDSPASTPALSFQEGLQEIDAFFAEEEAREAVAQQEGQQSASTHEDEFSTLMQNTDQSSGAGVTHDAAYPGISARPHDLTTSNAAAEMHEHNPVTQLVNAKSHDTGAIEVAQPSPLPSQTQVDETHLLSREESSCTRLDTSTHPLSVDLLEQTKISSLRLHNSSTQKPGSKDSRQPQDPEMTPPKIDAELPPSSEGRSSLIDEMRAGEQNELTYREGMRVEIPKINLQAHSTQCDSAVEFDETSTAADQPSHVIGEPTSSKKVASSETSQVKNTSTGITSKRAMKKTWVGEAVRMNEQAALKAETGTRLNSGGDSDSEALMRATLATKRKAGELSNNEFDESSLAAKRARRTTTAVQNQPTAQKSTAQTSSNKNAKSRTTQRPPRNPLGLNEIAKLTNSTLLGGEVPPQRRSNRRQTRAQKEAEVESEPNAGREAKRRHSKAQE